MFGSICIWWRCYFLLVFGGGGLMKHVPIHSGQLNSCNFRILVKTGDSSKSALHQKIASHYHQYVSLNRFTGSGVNPNKRRELNSSLVPRVSDRDTLATQCERQQADRKKDRIVPFLNRRMSAGKLAALVKLHWDNATFIEAGYGYNSSRHRTRVPTS